MMTGCLQRGVDWADASLRHNYSHSPPHGRSPGPRLSRRYILRTWLVVVAVDRGY